MITLALASIAQLLWEVSTLHSRLIEADKKLSLNYTFREISANPQLKDALERISTLSLKAVSLHQHNNSDSGIYKIFRNQTFQYLSDCESNVKNASLGVIRIQKEMSNVFWIEIINNIQRSYKTTNIINEFSDSFGQKKEKAFLDAQKKMCEKIGSNNVKRIFIYETEQQIENRKTLLKKQQEIGVYVKTLSLDNYNQLGQEHWSSIIGCSDFAIIDDEFVYITVVDDTTKKSAFVQLTNEQVKLDAAKKLFKLIDDNCEKYA